LSGWQDSHLTGAPLAVLFENTDARSKDYSLSKFRPGHADYTAWVKYKGFADMRGGGGFSGRLTAPLVFAGAIARQILSATHKVEILGNIRSIHGETDPTLFTAIIEDAKDRGDSVGGVVEVTATHVPAGLGGLFFDALEGSIASLLFSVPGVKGVSFGDGFELASKMGSQTNDEMSMHEESVVFHSNHNGGILGGISNGQPIRVNAILKPTPSISKNQSSVDIETKETIQLKGKGRHDPCIVIRALPVIEAAVAWAILNATAKESGK
jgi:chorismate synthase